MQALTGIFFWPVDLIWPVVQPMHAVSNGSGMGKKYRVSTPADSTLLGDILVAQVEPLAKCVLGCLTSEKFPLVFEIHVHLLPLMCTAACDD